MQNKVATTSEAARIVASNRKYVRNVPPISAEQAAREIDPLFPEKVGKALLDTLPDPPASVAPRAEKVARKFSISTEIAYRGRVLTVAAEGMSIDQFCDLMDDRGYAAPAPPALLSAPIATADDLPDGYKLCKKHGAPMKPRSKQGDVWNSHNVGTADSPLWCKGYRGPDSPGYEVE